MTCIKNDHKVRQFSGIYFNRIVPKEWQIYFNGLYD